jgi:dTMP kinase
VSAGRGRLVALEGGEGSGKSTQAARLAERLGAVLTREPGGTPAGERIRALLLDPATAGLSARAEALLMAAARAQHVTEVIRPALDAGRHVVTDRWVGSSLAYQGRGRGLAEADVAAVSAFAVDGVEADVVVLLDVPAATARARRARPPDRLEREGDGFHERVAEAYAAQAAAEPDRWLVVDGTGTPDEVAARVWDAVAPRLERGATIR